MHNTISFHFGLSSVQSTWGYWLESYIITMLMTTNSTSLPHVIKAWGCECLQFMTKGKYKGHHLSPSEKWKPQESEAYFVAFRKTKTQEIVAYIATLPKFCQYWLRRWSREAQRNALLGSKMLQKSGGIAGPIPRSGAQASYEEVSPNFSVGFTFTPKVVEQK